MDGMGAEAEGGIASINDEIHVGEMEQGMLYLDWCVKLDESTAQVLCSLFFLFGSSFSLSASGSE